MKIEKISENQIKFLLTNQDLKEREIKISELAQGSEKAQIFFRDIMTEAMIDCGFDISDAPIMIEAMSIAMDSVMIIVSKVTQDIDKVISLSPKSLDERKFKQQSIKIVEDIVEDDDLEGSIYIYSFKNIDDIISLSKRLCDIFKGKNILYKFEDRYFLSIENKISSEEDLDSILSEYGQKHISTVISNYYLSEHGDIIIKNNAISILANI